MMGNDPQFFKSFAGNAQQIGTQSVVHNRNLSQSNQVHMPLVNA